MEKNQSNLQDGLKTCRWCGYDANPLTAATCEVCDRSLDNAILNGKGPNKPNSDFPVRLLSLAALVLLLGGVGYWLWRQQTQVAIPPEEISRSAGVRLYPTMKEVPNVPQGLFSYHGAHSFASLTAQGMNEAISQAFPAFQLRYTDSLQGNPGSTVAVRMLIDNEISIAQIARPLEDAEIERAKTRNVTLEQIPVAIDGIVFYVHPDVSIPGLSLDQLQNIYLGKITNWKEVGGPDVAIVPFSLDPKAVGAVKQALGDVAEKMGRHVRIIRDNTGGVREVAATPGAISFGGQSTIIGQQSIRLVSLAKENSTNYVSAITESGKANQQAFRDGTYPITRRLFIAIRRDGTLEEQAGVAYTNLLLSEEGQRIIETAGFVSLYQPNN